MFFRWRKAFFVTSFVNFKKLNRHYMILVTFVSEIQVILSKIKIKYLGRAFLCESEK
jgi:hypothetical protein